MTARTSSRIAQPPPPGMKEMKGGIFYTVAGLVLGMIGFVTLMTLIQPAFDRIFVPCSSAAPAMVISQSDVVVAIVAGLLAVIFAEFGSRRYARPKWIGMSASILGIFTLLGGGLIAVELFLPALGNCPK